MADDPTDETEQRRRVLLLKREALRARQRVQAATIAAEQELLALRALKLLADLTAPAPPPSPPAATIH